LGKYYKIKLAETMKIWNSLITPPARFKPDHQLQARLLNVLLTITGLGLLLLIPTSQADRPFDPNPRTFIPEVLGLAVVLISYILNRLGFTRTSAIFFFLAVNALVIIYLSTEIDDIVSQGLQAVTPVLVIPIVSSGVIIGPIYSFIFAGISVISVLTLAIVRSGVGIRNMESPIQAITLLSIPISLFFVVAGLSWFFESNIRSLVARLTAQNQALDLVNRELARKREIELQLNRRINQLTNHVSQSFEEQNRDTADQFSALLEVTTTIEQLSATNEAISRVASQVDNTAQNALKVAEEGTNNVRQGLDALVLLNEQAQAVANSMDDLYNQARQIDQIIELITEVAEETNLLALNATIEAAGAREYGRRFASVANEVQRLANRSREAADQVRQVVGEIRKAIENASKVAQKGMRETNGVMRGTRQIEHTLEGIVAMVENTATLARQISLSIQQQRGATVQVVDTMRQISTISHTVARGSQELMDNVYELNDTVLQLSSVDNEE